MSTDGIPEDQDRLQRKIERLRSNIPKKLQQRDQWVMWKALPNEKTGKMKKVPFQPNGKEAKSNDPATWTSFNKVLSTLRSKRGTFSGIGYVFSKEGPYCGIDFDGCVNEDGQIEGWALGWITRFNSYAEWSPSGKGIHIICSGNLGTRSGKHTSIKDTDHDIGIFGTERYFTFTGDLLKGRQPNIRAAQEAIDELYSSLKETGGTQIPEGKGFEDNFGVKMEPQQIAPSVEAILDKIKKALNADKIQALIAGDTTGYASQSEADEALCFHLAFYTVDAAQIYEIIQTTELYLLDKRDSGHRKWDRHTYLAPTIGNALWMVSDRFKWSRTPKAKPKQKADEPPEPTPAFELPEAISATDLVAQPDEPIPMIIGKGLIPVGGYTILGGYAKEGKTTIAVQIVVCAATGEDFLTFPVEKKHVVLYLHLENSNPLMKQIVKDLIAGWGSEVKPDNLFILNGQGFCIENIDDRRQLRNRLIEMNIDLCVIDPISLAMKRDQNSYEVVRELLLVIKKIGEDTGTTFLLIHNMRKPGIGKFEAIHGLTGSSAWGNIAESIIGLEPWGVDTRKDYKRLSLKLRTHPEPDEDICLYRDPVRNIFCLQQGEPPKVRTSNVIKIVSDAQPVSHTALVMAIVEEAQVCDRTARRYIIEALKAKQIKKDDMGKYILA